MRRLGSIAAALFVAGLLAPALFVAPAAAASATVPKVVFVVGPSGYATDRYRSEARAAAAVARRYTPDVTEVYSPNATWPVVKKALRGASLVIYMGHGNGFPSRYRDSLYPPTQNGFGLNPRAGTHDDTTHQYFGEGKVATIDLAPNAVVLLHHLCYASGLSEPGLAEGTLDQAKQRVDNFAAGFIKAGASAVIAEAYTSPSRYVAAILGTQRSIDSIWRSSPTANDNTFAYASERSPGYVAEMDPAHASSGFERSIVLKQGLASVDVQAGARGSRNHTTTGGFATTDPGLPTLTTTGIRVATPTLRGTTSVSHVASLKVPFKIKNRDRLPKVLEASVRWDPVDVASSPVTGSSPATPPTILLPSAPPTDLDLVAPEQTGALVAPAALTINKASLSMGVNLPAAPGRYRMVITLHDKDGVAYDEETQHLIPTVLVRVTGDPDGAILAAPSNTLAIGSHVSLPVRVVNLGTAAWGHDRITTSRDRDRSTPAVSAELVGHWVALGGGAIMTIIPEVSVDLPPGLAPGGDVDASLGLDVPTVPGDYLLILDVVTPEHGSLTAAGVAPTIVRVKVVQPG